jgi:signal peptidase I
LPSSLTKPALYCKSGGVLALSGPELKDFLKAVLAKGADLRFRAQGSSMHPFIQDGDVITVSPLKGRPPKMGEVAAFWNRETKKLMVHRVVARPRGGYVMRGDSNCGPDGLLGFENLIGVVKRVERDGKTVCLGQGPERLFIALLSRLNLLQPLVHYGWQVFKYRLLE